MVDLRLRFALAPAWDKLAVKGKRMSLTDQLTNVADLKLNKRKGAFSVEPGPEDRVGPSCVRWPVDRIFL